MIQPITVMEGQVCHVGNMLGKETRGVEPDYEEHKMPCGEGLRHVLAGG